MELNWKKIGLIIGFLIFVGILGYGLYFFLLRPALPTVPTTNTPTNQTGGLNQANSGGNIPVGQTGGTLPGQNTNTNQPPSTNTPTSQPQGSAVANGGLTSTRALTNNRTLGVTISGDGNSVYYYDRNNGQFFRQPNSGNPIPLSETIFFSVDNVIWSPNKTEAIIEYPDGSNILYNFTKNQQFTLPAHWKDFSFSSGGNQIVFKSIGDSADTSWLAIASSDGSRATKVEHIGDKDATVYPSWSPNNQIVAMFSEDKDFNTQTLYFLGKNNENYRSMNIKGRGFEGLWSSDGDKLLYSVHSSDNNFLPTLWVASALPDTIGDTSKDLGLHTWVDKCSFTNNDTAYCAVPKNLAPGAGLIREEYDTVANDIYKIDLKTGFKTKIATPVGEHNIKSISVSTNEQYLYFISATDGKLYQMALR